MVLPAFGALCPPAIRVIRLPATENLASVAALIQIPLIRIRFSFSGLPSCPPVSRLRWMRRIVIASAAARSPAALLLRPGRNHAVAARVRDRLPQMLVLIFEKVHQRALLRHVSSEQFHRRLEVVVGKFRNRFLQIDVRSLQSLLQFLRIGDGRGPCSRIRSAGENAGENAVLHNDQVEHVADGANALAGLPVVLARHNARESGEFAGKRSGIFSESGLHSRRLRLRHRRHQSGRERAHSVLSQNLLHVELLYVALIQPPKMWSICRRWFKSCAASRRTNSSTVCRPRTSWTP